MRAVIIVPSVGAGRIRKILSIEAAGEFVLGSDEQAVEIEATGTPIDSFHWNGSEVVQGSYVSPEDQEIAEAKAAETEAHSLLQSRLSTFDYDLTASLIARMTPDEDLFAEIEAATTVAALKAAIVKVLEKITLTDTELEMMNGYREKYEAWQAAQS